MSHDCERLDSFLVGDLPPDDAALFAGHLAKCDACRDAIEQQRWIDGLLSSPLRQESESPRAEVLAAVQKSIAQCRRRVRLVASGLAAAAALIIAVGWTALWNRPTDHAIEQRAIAINDRPEPSPSPSLRGRGTQPPPRAVFVGGPDVIVVPVKTSHPNVTVVRVYPTYQYQPSFTVQASAAQPAAGSDFTWSNDLNGG